MEKTKEMDELERQLIAKYKTQDRNFGYNLDSGGNFQKEHSEETKFGSQIKQKMVFPLYIL